MLKDKFDQAALEVWMSNGRSWYFGPELSWFEVLQFVCLLSSVWLFLKYITANPVQRLPKQLSMNKNLVSFYCAICGKYDHRIVEGQLFLLIFANWIAFDCDRSSSSNRIINRYMGEVETANCKSWKIHGSTIIAKMSLQKRRVEDLDVRREPKFSRRRTVCKPPCGGCPPGGKA